MAITTIHMNEGDYNDNRMKEVEGSSGAVSDFSGGRIPQKVLHYMCDRKILINVCLALSAWVYWLT